MANSRLKNSLKTERERLVAQLAVIEGRRADKVAAIERVDRAMAALDPDEKAAGASS